MNSSLLQEAIIFIFYYANADSRFELSYWLLMHNHNENQHNEFKNDVLHDFIANWKSSKNLSIFIMHTLKKKNGGRDVEALQLQVVDMVLRWRKYPNMPEYAVDMWPNEPCCVVC